MFHFTYDISFTYDIHLLPTMETPRLCNGDWLPISCGYTKPHRLYHTILNWHTLSWVIFFLNYFLLQSHHQSIQSFYSRLIITKWHATLHMSNNTSFITYKLHFTCNTLQSPLIYEVHNRKQIQSSLLYLQHQYMLSMWFQLLKCQEQQPTYKKETGHQWLTCIHKVLLW